MKRNQCTGDLGTRKGQNHHCPGPVVTARKVRTGNQIAEKNISFGVVHYRVEPLSEKKRKDRLNWGVTRGPE